MIEQVLAAIIIFLVAPLILLVIMILDTYYLDSRIYYLVSYLVGNCTLEEYENRGLKKEEP